ncbi:MAG: hypothetical protein WDN45_00200 [Caulobacteraceae bacterium]
MLVASAAAAEPAHQGVAFSAAAGAKARLVEPDGRTVIVDDGSDLVAPASIASHHTQAAIAGLIRTMAKSSAARVAPLAPAKAAPAQPSIPAS